jgi:aspartyl protease family protein
MVVRRGILALALLHSLTCRVYAADVEVLALFGERAMLRIDGEKHLLRKGQSTPGGIRLLDVSTEGASIEIDGDDRYYPLGVRVRAHHRAPDTEEVQIWRDPSGMFRTVGSINGLPVKFLVDTGASSVAMNSAQARRLGIDFRVIGEPAAVMTASRLERVYRVRLDTVKVGAITLRNVEAVVLDGAQPDSPLLGMSFLGRLQMANDGRRLTLSRIR